MPTRIFNRFDTWIWAEDTLVPWNWRIIDGSGVTWLKTWLWITLWPKSNKQIITNWPMRWIWLGELSNNNDYNFAYGASWEIYRFDSADLTPIYTHTSWLMVECFFEIKSRYYFQVDTDNDLWQATSRAFTTVNEAYYTMPSWYTEYAPVLKVGNIVYVWWWESITKFSNTSTDPWSTAIQKTFFWGSIKWLTALWSQIYAYSTNWQVYIWDWWSDTLTWANWLGFIPRDVYSSAWITYITNRNGEFKAWNWWQFTPLSVPFTSKRLQDNTTFKTKLDFGTSSTERGQIIATVWDNIYLWCNDSTPWIYVYWSIAPWFPRWFHKLITSIHDWTAIDEIYALAYSETNKKLYYSYKAGSQYGIDYIDMTSHNTAQSWYFVTEVFSANTTFTKRPKELRVTCENIASPNYVKIYERVNNWTWTLLRTINSTDTIFKKDISNYTKENIDVQFKLELYNSTWWTTPPVVREVYYDYEVTPK